MGFLGRLGMAFSLAMRAFQEGMVTSNPEKDWLSFNKVNFGAFESRRVRYDILWSLYESTIYRDIHEWAVTYKTRFALYKYIRSIYNPAYRLGEFWKSHLWGGALDPDAMDQGALPIITDNEAIRPYLAQIWKESNLAINKDVWTLYGSVLGDVIVRVVDDTDAGRVYFEYLSPSNIAELVKDNRGNIKAYTYIKEVLNAQGKIVVFKETCENDGGQIIYRTYLNDTPYDWGNGVEWIMPYGFVPMVHIQHNDIGGEWGWSELHPMRSKLHEADDVASMLSDQIRKTINSGWFFAGLRRDEQGNKSVTTKMASTNQPSPGREQERALYSSDPQSKAYPLVAPLDIEGSILHIQEIIKEIERDYPELRFDNLRASGTVSGESLRVARQPAETKVYQRRANYDVGLVRLNQMALSIGGFRGYFGGIGLDSFGAGQLDHTIDKRPVFFAGTLDDLEEEQVFWATAAAAIKAGISLPIWLKRKNWTDEDILAVTNSPEYLAKQALIDQLSNGSNNNDPPPA